LDLRRFCFFRFARQIERYSAAQQKQTYNQYPDRSAIHIDYSSLISCFLADIFEPDTAAFAGHAASAKLCKNHEYRVS
jgi:hypothetical protein